MLYLPEIAGFRFGKRTFGGESLVDCIYEGRVALIIANYIAAFIFFDRWISLKEGCVGQVEKSFHCGHWIVRYVKRNNIQQQ